MADLMPVVGMGATELYEADRLPYEIVSVVDDRCVFVREMDARRVDKRGACTEQEWSLKSRSTGATRKVVKTAAGEWREETNGILGNQFLIGRAEKYFDYGY